MTLILLCNCCYNDSEIELLPNAYHEKVGGIMKKGWIRIFCFVFTLSMAFTVLAGCNKASGKPSTVTSGSAVSNSAFVDPKFDLAGREIIIYCKSDFKDPEETDPLYQSIKDTEKKYNCKIKWTPIDIGTAHQDILASTVSGTYICDAFWVEWYNASPKFSAAGAIVDLSQYYDFKNDPDWASDYGNFGTWYEGKKYGINVPSQNTGYGIWYNAALLEKANIPDLWEYVKNDTWNWDTFRDVCKKLTALDEVDYAYIDENPFATFVVANGGKYLDMSSKIPKFILGENQNDIKALQFAYDLVNVDKVMPPMNWITENGDYFAVMQMGKAAMYPYSVGFGPWLAKNAGIDPKDLGWIYIPKGPDAKDYYINNLTNDAMYAVPTTAKDKDKIVCVLQDMFKYWSAEKTSPVPLSMQKQLTIESAEYDGILSGDGPRVENNKKLFMDGYKNTVYLYDLNYNIYQQLREVYYWPMERGEVQVVSGLDAVKQSMQDLVNSYYTTK